MDLSNNRLGRERAAQGVPVISLNDPGLVYGAGGPQGQPNLSFSDYVNGRNSSYFSNDADTFGFLLNPGKSTLLQPVVFKDPRK